MPPGIIALTAIIVTFLLYARSRKRSREPGIEVSSSPTEWWLFAAAMGVLVVVEIAFFLDRGELDWLVLAGLSLFAGLWAIYKAVNAK
jgi:hypothetical protein